MTQTSQPTLYDQVPYRALAFPEAHPDRLATIAALFGMQPANVERCRVLGIGCAGGGNLIPMAVQLPDSRFVGIDLSARQIASAQAITAKLGLTNIELQHRDILHAGPDLGAFDYIIAHGVYSWVPPEVQKKLLEICASNLAPGGVAYVSYSVYPGVFSRHMVRDLMIYHTRDITDASLKVRRARQVVDLLAKAVPPENNPHGMYLREMAARLSRTEDWSLLHDDLGAINEPCYFHEFMERAATVGMKYLGDSNFNLMCLPDLSPEISRMREGSSDAVRAQQYADFVRNNAFRRTLLCHAATPVAPAALADRAASMWASSPAKPAGNVNADALGPAVFELRGAKTTVTEPAWKKILLQLGSVWPCAMRVSDLIVAGAKPSDPATMGLTLIRGFANGVVELSVRGSAFTRQISPQPAVSGLARHQAESGDTVTTGRHENARPNEMIRQLMLLLDGAHDRATLVTRMLDLVRSGALKSSEVTKIGNDQERLNQLLTDAVDEALAWLAENALLIP